VVKKWTSCSLRNFWNTQLVNSVPLSVCRRIGCVHETIGIPPAEVTWANQTTVSKRLYGRKGPTKSCKFSIGDRVRLSKAKRTFKKEYLPNWTEELLTVVKCIETRPPVKFWKEHSMPKNYRKPLRQTCERCGYKMRPSLIERLRRLGFLCVWNTSTSWFSMFC
jgi:hypothetical protein